MDDFSQRAAPTHTTTHRSFGFIYLIPVGLLLGFLLFIIVYGYEHQDALPKAPVPTPTPGLAAVAPSNAPSPTFAAATPEPAAAASNTPILVLNGSGKAGVAGLMKESLAALGYTNVTTGNAGDYTYTGITIRAGKNQQDAATALETALAKQYTVHPVAFTATASGSITVIVGK